MIIWEVFEIRIVRTAGECALFEDVHNVSVLVNCSIHILNPYVLLMGTVLTFGFTTISNIALARLAGMMSMLQLFV